MTRWRNLGSVPGLAAALAIALMLVSAMAAAAEQAPNAAAAIPARVDAVTLRVDWLLNSYHSPFFVGVAKGWYRQAGIDLSIREGRGSGNVIQLVGSKFDTFGFATADAVVRGVQNNIPVVSVANIMPKNADTIFVLKKTGITRPQDLKGRTIASTPGGTSDTLLPAFLRGAGLATGDVRIVSVDAAVKLQTVLQGKADAMTGPAWSKSIFSAAGGTHGFPYADYGVQVVGYGIVTNTDTVKNNPDLVRRFVDVTLRAWDYALKNPEEALRALENASPENARPEVKATNRVDLPEAFRLVAPAVPGKPLGTQNEADWEAMQKQLIEYHVIKEGRPVSQYMTNAFTP